MIPQVSVVIPTYNRADLLRSAIQSVFHQTFENFEIIVVDDASIDNTAEVVNSFNDERINYIRHETNEKEAGARNTGVANSNGDYIAFLDDDDEWLPEKLEMQVDLMDRSSAKVGGVYTGFLKVDSSGNVLRTVIPDKRGDIFNELLMKNWIGIPSVLLLKRLCFEKVGLFDGSIPFGLDRDMWIRISKEFHFEYIKKPVVKYYSHENDRLSTNHELVIKGKVAMIEKYDQLFALDEKSYSHLYLNIGVLYCYIGDTRKGREALLKAINLYPFEIRHYFNLFLSLFGASIFKWLKKAKEKAVGDYEREVVI